MSDFLKVLSLFLLAALGWWLGGAAPRLAPRLNHHAAASVLGLSLLDAVAGVFPFAIPFHRALGYGAVLAACLLASWAAGLFLRRAITAGDNESGLGALAAFLVVPVSLLTAVTGTLGPTHAPTQHPVLFPLLHLVLAPLLLLALLAAWFAIARRAAREG